MYYLCQNKLKQIDMRLVFRHRNALHVVTLGTTSNDKIEGNKNVKSYKRIRIVRNNTN